MRNLSSISKSSLHLHEFQTEYNTCGTDRGQGQAKGRVPGSSPGWTSHYPELSEVVHNSSSVANQWEEKNQMKKNGESKCEKKQDQKYKKKV